MKNVLVFIGFMFLLIGTGIWVSAFLVSVLEYDQYCELVSSQNLRTPFHYSAWEPGRNISISFIFLFFVWLPFLDYALRQKSYPYLRQKLTYKGLKLFSRSASRSLYERLYALVFGYFLRVNQKVGAKIGVWFMKLETFEHVHLLTKVLKWVIIPFSLTYFFTEFFFFKNNVLDSMLIGVTLFFYSNFVPIYLQYFEERPTETREMQYMKVYHVTKRTLFFCLLLSLFCFCFVARKLHGKQRKLFTI